MKWPEQLVRMLHNVFCTQSGEASEVEGSGSVGLEVPREPGAPEGSRSGRLQEVDGNLCLFSEEVVSSAAARASHRGMAASVLVPEAAGDRSCPEAVVSAAAVSVHIG